MYLEVIAIGLCEESGPVVVNLWSPFFITHETFWSPFKITDETSLNYIPKHYTIIMVNFKGSCQKAGSPGKTLLTDRQVMWLRSADSTPRLAPRLNVPDIR